jgi:hypothetical protein
MTQRMQQLLHSDTTVSLINCNHRCNPVWFLMRPTASYAQSLTIG